jgi:Leucine-rich repeat (LRR) protein
MGQTLKKLDLSSNCIRRIENLEVLQNLRELNMSFNKIEEIENL